MGRIKDFQEEFGATPLDPDEAEGLIPSHVRTQSQLNIWEQNNILLAEQWVSRQKFKIDLVLTVDFIQKMHHRMFNKTWGWAGKFRKTNKNIGVDWPTISVKLQLLLDDIHYQIQQKSFIEDEIATRFHHRLVAIHCFPNGNGRHARFMADIVLLALGKQRFTWGSKERKINISATRKYYINALRSADKMDYQPLLDFVRL